MVSGIEQVDVSGMALPNLGYEAHSPTLSARAKERALGVLADPVALKQAGTGAALLAIVNERCGDDDRCRLKYADIAKDLGVSLTTVKAWAESLATLGYFSREACGPAGVEIRLCSERWPSRNVSGAAMAVVDRTVSVLDAIRMTMNCALLSAADDARRIGDAAA